MVLFCIIKIVYSPKKIKVREPIILPSYLKPASIVFKKSRNGKILFSAIFNPLFIIPLWIINPTLQRLDTMRKNTRNEKV